MEGNKRNAQSQHIRTRFSKSPYALVILPGGINLTLSIPCENTYQVSYTLTAVFIYILTLHLTPHFNVFLNYVLWSLLVHISLKYNYTHYSNARVFINLIQKFANVPLKGKFNESHIVRMKLKTFYSQSICHLTWTEMNTIPPIQLKENCGQIKHTLLQNNLYKILGACQHTSWPLHTSAGCFDCFHITRLK